MKSKTMIRYQKKDLDLLEEKIKKLSEWVDEDEVKDQ